MSHHHQLCVCLLSTRASYGTTSMGPFWCAGMCWHGVGWGRLASLFQGSVRRWACVATQSKANGLNRLVPWRTSGTLMLHAVTLIKFHKHAEPQFFCL